MSGPNAESGHGPEPADQMTEWVQVEKGALDGLIAAANAVLIHGTLVFRNDDVGRQLPFDGTAAERTAYALVVPVEDGDRLADVIAGFEDPEHPPTRPS